MRPEKVHARIREIKHWAEEVQKKLDEKAGQVFSRANSRIAKLQASCKHEFDCVSHDGQWLMCLCGASKPARTQE